MPSAAPERRRLAILDGGHRFDLVVSRDTTVAELLAGAGIQDTDGVLGVMTGHGALLPLNGDADAVEDGDVLVLVQDSADERGPASARAIAELRTSVSPLWWLLGLTGFLASAAGLTLAEQLGDSALLGPWAALMASAAVAAMVIWAFRLPPRGVRGISAAAGPLLMAFAAGCLATPHFASRPVQLPVVAGLTGALALAALGAYLTRNAVARASLGTAVLVIAVLDLLWLITLLLVLPASSAAMLSLGAAPVVLRVIPSFLLNVTPGHLVDMKRFMLLRWTVRQDVPAGENPVSRSDVQPLVDDSAARLVTGTVLVSMTAALSVLGAVPPPDAPMLETIAWTFLIPFVVAALLLSTRTAYHPVLRWAPRATAVVVFATGLHVFLSRSPSMVLVLLALLVLLAAFGVVALLVPIHRGLRSLFWSRAGDIVETLATVLCFPAALLAAGTIDLVRGLMA